MVTVNGKEEAADGQVLSDYLNINGYNCKRIAVEMNGEIVPKAKYSEVIMHSKDSIEIVSFVGGG